MTPLEAAGLLETLARGADPVTGEILPAGHVCRDARVSQALRLAAQALRGPDAPREDVWVRKDGRPNAGRPWTEEDNAQLEALFRQGMSPEAIAPLLDRRPRGVANQLRALGLEGDGASKARAPWTRADDEELTRLFPEWTEQQLARRFGRSAYAIHCRLIRLGVIENDMISPSVKGD
ncbi:MAG: hypothetical protein ACI4O7_05460 [Aristaeellaceae bacterium]